MFGTSTFQGADAKILAIPSGISIGGSGFGTQNVGLTVPSGMGGTLTIQNAGSIIGAGGSGGGGGLVEGLAAVVEGVFPPASTCGGVSSGSV